MKKPALENLKPTLSRLAAYLAIIVVAGLGVSTIKNVRKVFEIRHEVEKERMLIEKLEKENQVLTQKVRDIQGVEFVEKQVRNKLGLVKPGETVVILPDEETLIKLAPKINTEEENLPDPVWRRWLKLFI